MSKGRLILTMVALVWVVYALHLWQVQRNVNKQLSTALARLGEIRYDVAGVYMQEGDLEKADSGYGHVPPAGMIDDGVAEISVEDGRIEAAFTEAAASGLAGNRLHLVPGDAGGTALSWRCTSPDIEKELLPEPCR